MRRTAAALSGWIVTTVALLASPPAHATLPIQHWQTATGVQVYFIENSDLPMVDISVDFPAGSGRDLPSTSGLAGLTLQMLRFGADGMSEDDISRRIADVGAQLGVHFDRDRAGYSVRSLSSPRELDQAIDTLARMLQRPSFPEPAVQREKERTVASLKESDAKPEVIAERWFYRLAYGAHPYMLRPGGEVDTVSRLTRAQLVEFYQRHYRAGDAVVAVIGDLSRVRADSIVQRLTNGLAPGKANAAALPPVPPVAAALTERVPFQSAQAHIVIGCVGMRRADPDYFPLWVGNYILGGGGFSSRLTDETREKRGLAYSAYSYFAPLREAGPFEMGLQTKQSQADEALAVASETLRKFVLEGPTESEVATAKENVVGSFPLRIDTNRKLHDYLGVIGFYRLPLDYLDTFPARIEAVTRQQIKDAFARRVHPDRMITVVVGGEEGG